MRSPAKTLQVARTQAKSSSHPIVSKSKKSSPKKAQVIPVAVRTLSPPTATESEASSPAPTKIEVVHIPINGKSRPKIINVPLIDNPGNALNTYTAEREWELQHIPDLRSYSATFNWRFRFLVDANMKFEGSAILDGWEGMYYAYRCVESGAGLPVNEHFEPVRKVQPYGDVFVFRLKRWSESGAAEYGTMERDFLLNYAHHGVARSILCSIAACEAI